MHIYLRSKRLWFIGIADLALAFLGPVLAIWLAGSPLFRAKRFSATETGFYVAVAASALLIGATAGLVVHFLTGRRPARTDSATAPISIAMFAAEVLFCTAGLLTAGGGAYTLNPFFCLSGPVLWTVGALTPILSLGGISALREHLRSLT